MQMNLTLPEGVVVKAVRSGKHSSANQDPDLIKVDSEYAQQVYDELIYEIESRPDFVQAGEIVEKNLDEEAVLSVEDSLIGHQRAMKDSLSAKPQRATSDVFKWNTLMMSSALVVHSSVDEPPVKKLKVVLEDIPIPSPTPLNLVRPNIINNIPYDQYTTNLFISGSFDFSLTPHPKVADKGNGIAQTFEDDQLKQLLPFMDEGGSVPKLPNLQQFSTSGEGQMTLEDTKAQMEEIKRLADLKAEKEKYEKKLKRVLITQELKAQAVELAAYKAKRAKMMEYNHCINFRDDPLPITKFNYRVNNSTKEVTMRIVRNNQPLNLMVYEKFVLKKLGGLRRVRGGNTLTILLPFEEEQAELVILSKCV
ncbi:hypothetical protein Tco_0451893 [Tanacetum coccineum]